MLHQFCYFAGASHSYFTCHSTAAEFSALEVLLCTQICTILFLFNYQRRCTAKKPYQQCRECRSLISWWWRRPFSLLALPSCARRKMYQEVPLTQGVPREIQRDHRRIHYGAD